jgi:hypothetical protein
MSSEETAFIEQLDTADNNVTRRIVEILTRLGGQGGPEEILRGLDSIGLVELVVNLEEAFGLEIPDEALSDEVFSSVPILARTIRQLGGR